MAQQGNHRGAQMRPNESAMQDNSGLQPNLSDVNVDAIKSTLNQLSTLQSLMSPNSHQSTADGMHGMPAAAPPVMPPMPSSLQQNPTVFHGRVSRFAMADGHQLHNPVGRPSSVSGAQTSKTPHQNDPMQTPSSSDLNTSPKNFDKSTTLR